MRDPKIILHRFQIIFQVGCFLIAVYFTTLFSAEYSDNSDIQLITIKKFNQDKDNKYPSFSFCFKSPRFHWYHDTKIYESYGLNATQYQRMLKGENEERYHRNDLPRFYTKEPIFLNDGPIENFDKFHLKIEDFVRSLHFATESSSHDTIISNSFGWNVSKEQPISLAFESADRICFSRNTIDSLGLVRLSDSITLDSSLFPFHRDEEMEVFVHYPDQLIASLGNEKYLASFTQLLTLVPNIYGQVKPQALEFKLTEAKRIKKRHDSKNPCNRNIVSYDGYLKKQIRETMMNEIGCIPIYLQVEPISNTKYKECVSPMELQRADKIIGNLKQILEENEKPCDEILILTIDSVNVRPVPEPDDATIKFLYTEKVYEEIEYIRAIGFENWLSNVGGFVGIFLGYSMMQFPEFMLFFAATFTRRGGHWKGNYPKSI